MSRELARWPAIAVAVAPLFVSVFVGCTEDETPAAPIATGPVCPSQFADANGKACNSEGQSCDYSYQCPGANQQARCLCASAGGELKYSCTSAANEGPIKPGSNPVCLDVLPNDPEACPASTAAANRNACNKPGLSAYEGISAAARILDFCFCKGAGGAARSPSSASPRPAATRWAPPPPPRATPRPRAVDPLTTAGGLRPPARPPFR